jgi:AcrR family transcriptional regulator
VRSNEPRPDVATSTHPVGRPRSETARRAILAATTRLLEQMSVRDLTVDAIAKAAAVGKPTIYRWWPNKTAVAIDAFFENCSPPLIYPANGSGRAALIAQLHRDVVIWNGRAGRMIAEILGDGQANAEILFTFRERYIEGRRSSLRDAISKAKLTGEITDALDADIIIDLFCGPIFYRLLVGHLSIDEVFMDRLVDTVFHGLAPR